MRKPVAPALKENNIDKNRIQTGVESVYLTKGDSVIIGDDLTIGTPVEILIRRFGRPDRLLRDTDANVYYFVYSSLSEWEDLVFAVGDRKIRRVAMMPAASISSFQLGVYEQRHYLRLSCIDLIGCLWSTESHYCRS